MVSSSSVAFLLSLLVLLCLQTAVYSNTATKWNKNDKAYFVNDNVIRTIDVSSNLVREKRAIAITRAPGTSDSSSHPYYIAVELPKGMYNASVAFIAAKDKDSDSKLELAFAGEEKDFPSRNVLFYAFVVPEGKLVGDKRYLVMVDIVYSHSLEPYPTVIDQNQKQNVRFHGNIYTPSPYKTLKQKLKLTLYSSSVQSFTKDKQGTSERSGKTVSYGPYEKEPIEQFAFEPLQLHYENNSPLLTDVEVTRELWLSHWSQTLSVEEWHCLRNDGARLEKQFSRIELVKQKMTGQQRTSAVHAFELELPAAVKDAYYRDDVGNVSTSNLRLLKSKSLLELRPRFPLFGGWNYNWYHGYNLNLWDFVSFVTGDSATHSMEIDLVQGVKNVPIDKLKMKIVLPEGAKDVKVTFPSLNSGAAKEPKVRIEKTFTYLDTIGRPTVLFEVESVVDEQFGEKFKVEYKYPAIEYLRKPLVASVAFLLMFLMSMIYWRLDLTISGGTVKKNL